jgi:hypothetical protein
MSNDPQRAMLTLRVIWFAIILGQAIFFVVALALRGQAGAPNIPSLPYLALAFAAVAIPAGAFLRRFIIRKGIAEGKPLRGLATGTILFLASCEGPSFLGSVCILLTGNLVPAMWVPILATVLMLIVFPRLDQLVE